MNERVQAINQQKRLAAKNRRRWWDRNRTVIDIGFDSDRRRVFGSGNDIDC
jgi:hypothetical protein